MCMVRSLMKCLGRDVGMWLMVILGGFLVHFEPGAGARQVYGEQHQSKSRASFCTLRCAKCWVTFGHISSGSDPPKTPATAPLSR